MKVLINKCFGGFSVSQYAIDRFNERTGYNVRSCYALEEHRDDPVLIDIVEELGEMANGFCAKLVIAEVPDGYDYSINDYDGMETIRLHISEDHLRKLIRLGNEDDIVDYVMKAN